LLPKNVKINNKNIILHVVLWVCNTVSHKEGRTKAQGVLRLGVLRVISGGKGER
jgi:hypothetical protein